MNQLLKVFLASLFANSLFASPIPVVCEGLFNSEIVFAENLGPAAQAEQTAMNDLTRLYNQEQQNPIIPQAVKDQLSNLISTYQQRLATTENLRELRREIYPQVVNTIRQISWLEEEFEEDLGEIAQYLLMIEEPAPLLNKVIVFQLYAQSFYNSEIDVPDTNLNAYLQANRSQNNLRAIVPRAALYEQLKNEIEIPEDVAAQIVDLAVQYRQYSDGFNERITPEQMTINNQLGDLIEKNEDQFRNFSPMKLAELPYTYIQATNPELVYLVLAETLFEKNSPVAQLANDIRVYDRQVNWD